jgi:ABC-2 type transport system permease protein
MTYAVPARYFIPPLTSVFVVGDLWPMFVRSILAMLGFGLLFFGLAFRVTRRRIA